MDKLQYKKLLRLREDQEKLFHALISFGLSPRDIINKCGINHKRAWYILGKWCDKDIYEYGTCLDNGWLLKELSPR